jgi:hypothetical protein
MTPMRQSPKRPKSPKQAQEEIRELMERHKDHDEEVFRVRPDIVLDATPEDADWPPGSFAHRRRRYRGNH